MTNTEKDMAARGRRNRRRGASFERDVVNKLKPVFPNVARNLAQTRDGGYDIAIPGMLIECKVGKQPNIRAAMEQCRAAVQHVEGKQGAAKGSVSPVVVSKKDREGILVTMEWDAFYGLLAAVYGVKGE